MSAVQDSAVEAMAKAHCDFFGGEGWWDTGLIADTKPKAMEAMRVAIAAMPTDTTLREQRDELLEALEKAAEWFEQYAVDHYAKAKTAPGYGEQHAREVKGATNRARANELRSAVTKARA